MTFSRSEGWPLEKASCPLCGADRPRVGRSYDLSPFRVAQCSGCDLWYLSPRVPEVEADKIYSNPAYYGGGSGFGYADSNGSYAAQEEALRQTFRRFVAELSRLGLTGGRLLEVGAGYGYLLEEARDKFETCTGIERGADAVARIQSKGFRGIRGRVEDLPPEEHFDLIVSADVIEHVYRPIAFVEQLKQHLAPRGALVFATPHMDNIWRRLMGRRWPSFKPPEHVAFYTPATLTDLFRRCGAIQSQVLPFPHAYPLGLVASKLGFSFPDFLARRSLWLPGALFAVLARFAEGTEESS